LFTRASATYAQLQSALANSFTTKEKKMKKKLYALSGVFLIVLVIAGLWASKAGGFTQGDQAIDSSTSRKVNGVSMEDMARGADLIVFGTCTGTTSQWIDGRRLITLATISVAETLKGGPQSTLTVVVPGGHGSKGKFQLATTVAGAPTMGPNEEMALFLVSANDEFANAYSVVGLNAGKFSIVKDTADEKVVTSVPMKVRAPSVTGLSSGNPQVMKLSEFKAMIEGYIQ
jgi:hypothetical protein